MLLNVIGELIVNIALLPISKNARKTFQYLIGISGSSKCHLILTDDVY